MPDGTLLNRFKITVMDQWDRFPAPSTCSGVEGAACAVMDEPDKARRCFRWPAMMRRLLIGVSQFDQRTFIIGSAQKR